MCINKPFVVPGSGFRVGGSVRHATGFNSKLGTRNPERGFSLVELIVFIVIVSIALAGVLAVMNLTTKHSADPLVRKQAIAVADSLLEEIELQNFNKSPTDFPGPYTQPNRQYFDNIGDYNGFAPGGVFPIDSATPIPGLTGYSVSVTVANADLGPAGSVITAASGKAKLITVTVTGPDNTTIVLSGYRTAYGP
ncbi:MAG: prepilin-type N-terminal cleavage/methylation domain-containing protein [Burkholderiales bacterium]